MKLDMRFRGFAGMMFRMFVVRMREMGVMRACFVIAVGNVGRRFAMMFGGVVVVFCGMFVMFGGAFGVRHGRFPFLPHLADGVQ
jgi:hypothetical protein